MTGFRRLTSNDRIRDVKRKPLVAATAAITLAVAVTPLPPGLLNGGVGTSELRTPEALQHDHIETAVIELAIATRTERELRPLATRPFNNSTMFTNPIAPDWQPQSYVWGPPLALLAS